MLFLPNLLSYKIVGAKMITKKYLFVILISLLFISCSEDEPLNTEDEILGLVEQAIGEQMIVQATIAAHLVAVAEAAGLSTEEINLHLKQIANNTIIDEFWITDSTGHAYLTNTGVDFTFSPNANEQPQAYVFWDLITGAKTQIIQESRKRELDDQIFKYAGVAGVDKKRIVQVGYNASNINVNADIENVVGEQMVVQAEIAAYFVAIAEAAGLTTDQINERLISIVNNSVLNEFWITDSNGHAYLTNTGIDFTFSPDSSVQPQAYIFWKLITGEKTVIIQEARVREIDNQIFKFVGVRGLDIPRIVQVGLSATYFMK